MEIPRHILELIEKYLSSTISGEELKALNAWYHEFDDSMAEVDLANLSELVNEEDLSEQLSSDIYNRLMNRSDMEMPKRRISARKTFAAAAILLIFIFGAGYFYLHQNPQADDAGITATHIGQIPEDLAPGGEKARLTLADGSVIILDTTKNGVIGQQGLTNIEKVNNGILTYSSTATSTSNQILYNEINTPRGGTYQITLSDGTRVWLNAASKLRFPTSFPGQTREVQLMGEAYFEVAKNATQPFLVHTDQQTVQVLGTHFNINAYPDESVSQTTLLEGKVKVFSSRFPQSAKTLMPGQQATLQSSGAIKINLHPDLEQVTGWKNGDFVFHSTDLRTILRSISRWYDADIIYNSKNNPVFTGQISKQLPVSKVFALLSLTNEIHYKIEGRIIKVSSE